MKYTAITLDISKLLNHFIDEHFCFLFLTKSIVTLITHVCRLCNGPFPLRQNFEKKINMQKYHHSLNEHPKFTKIAKFGSEML